MGNTYTTYSLHVPASNAQRVWLFGVLDYLLGVHDAPKLDADFETVTPTEEILLGGAHLHEDFLELKRGVLEDSWHTEYYADPPNMVGPESGIRLLSEDSGSVDFAVYAMALLTGKYPESYPRPLLLSWAQISDHGSSWGGKIAIYKGYLDFGEVEELLPDFCKGVDAEISASRLLDSVVQEGNAETAEAVNEALNELIQKLYAQAAQDAYSLSAVDRAALLMTEGSYSEEDLKALLFGSPKAG